MLRHKTWCKLNVPWPILKNSLRFFSIRQWFDVYIGNTYHLAPLSLKVRLVWLNETRVMRSLQGSCSRKAFKRSKNLNFKDCRCKIFLCHEHLHICDILYRKCGLSLKAASLPQKLFMNARIVYIYFFRINWIHWDVYAESIWQYDSKTHAPCVMIMWSRQWKAHSQMALRVCEQDFYFSKFVVSSDRSNTGLHLLSAFCNEVSVCLGSELLLPQGFHFFIM